MLPGRTSTAALLLPAAAYKVLSSRPGRNFVLWGSLRAQFRRGLKQVKRRILSGANSLGELFDVPSF